MVKLQNLDRDDRFIWCDYYPENDSAPGFIKVDLETEQITEKITAPYEESLGTNMYAHHAMLKLISLKDKSSLPKTTGAAWF